MPTRLFTSKTRVDILKLFMLKPEERFYARQIAKIISKNPHGVLRELENLEAASLLEKSIDGNRVYFNVNKKCPIYGEVRGIFLKTVGISDLFKKHFPRNT